MIAPFLTLLLAAPIAAENNIVNSRLRAMATITDGYIGLGMWQQFSDCSAGGKPALIFTESAQGSGNAVGTDGKIPVGKLNACIPNPFGSGEYMKVTACTPGTSYVYQAYADDACATVNGTAITENTVCDGTAATKAPMGCISTADFQAYADWQEFYQGATCESKQSAELYGVALDTCYDIGEDYLSPYNFEDTAPNTLNYKSGKAAKDGSITYYEQDNCAGASSTCADCGPDCDAYDFSSICFGFTFNYLGTPVSGSLTGKYSPECTDDSKACFAGSETVLLESGTSEPISNVRVGDRIQVANADGSFSFSDVVFVPHKPNSQKTSYVQLTTEAGRSLKATPAHLIPVGSCSSAAAPSLTAMDKVAVGNCLVTVAGPDKIIESKVVLQSEGIYTVVAAEKNGHIVVNEIVASSFAVNHGITNMYYHLHRALYSFLPTWMLQSESAVLANLMVQDLTDIAI